MRIKTSLWFLSLLASISFQVQAEAEDKTEMAEAAKARQVTGKIFADNRFTLFVNGQKVMSDPIKFMPLNTVKVKFNTTYPAVYAIKADDYAHPETGLEKRHTKMGTGGLILEFSDGTISNANWKCKSFSKGPTDKACLDNLPKLNCFIENTPIPDNWMASDFDDSNWNETREFSAIEIYPRKNYAKGKWGEAKFIWAQDLEIDNTVLCRLTVKEPLANTDSSFEPENQKAATQKMVKSNESIKDNLACENKDTPFLKFSERINTYCDDNYLYIESDGIAKHSMMMGITEWNQQVPKPQAYKDKNAWRIPLHPKKSHKITPNPAEGPIAIAINGVPIFAPSKQGGFHGNTHSPNLIGELDICGGHAGHGDDYHYHSVPKCLISSLKDPAQPIAYALDGYPLYGYLDADGKKPEFLDECNGRVDKKGNYQYFSSAEFPYVNACFKGEVDLQRVPQTENLRMQGLPISVDIYDFQQFDNNHYRLSYRYKDKEQFIDYQKHDEDCYLFYFSNEGEREIYCTQTTDDTADELLAPRSGENDLDAEKQPYYNDKGVAEEINKDEDLLNDVLSIPRIKHYQK